MRPTKVSALVAAASLAVAGGAAVALRRDGETERIKEPVLSFTQTPTRITLRIRNVNTTWGLRNQTLSMFVRHPDGIPINSYGPYRFSGVEGHPEFGRVHCCLITELPPGGEYTFVLLPSRYTVGGITIKIEGPPPGWIKM